MAGSEFQLAFDGPGLRRGTMDVNELASSLLAIGDLVQEANRRLNANRAEVSVRVKSDFKKGSFEVSLLVNQSLLEQARNLVIPGTTAVISGAALVKLLFGTEIGKKGLSGIAISVLDIWKRFKGEKPKETVEDAGKKIVISITGDGNKVNVDATALSLYRDDTVRASIAGIVRPLSKEGVERLDFRKGDKTINAITKADLPPDFYEGTTSALAVSKNVLMDRREAALRVIRANFDKGKWGFSDGAASFSADITDEIFRRRLDAREVGFYKGDMLRVILATTQTITADGQRFQTRYEIEKVIAHIHAPKQQELIE